MHRFKAEDLIVIVSMLSKAIHVGEHSPNEIIPKLSNDQDLVMSLRVLYNKCKEIELEMSALAIESLIGQLQHCDNPQSLFASRMAEINNRIYDELHTFAVFAIPRLQAKQYFENTIPFGQTVLDKFPSAAYDVEESAKCFATARFTACVMHLSRALEVVINAYGKLLGVTLTMDQPSWGAILKETGDMIAKRNGSKSTNSHLIWPTAAEKTFCLETQALLSAIKNAWRNPSMHAGKQYDESQAEDVFRAVKGLMRHLATHLDEVGNFAA